MDLSNIVTDITYRLPICGANIYSITYIINFVASHTVTHNWFLQKIYEIEVLIYWYILQYFILMLTSKTHEENTCYSDGF